jgi:hypothetical protein
MAGPPFWVRAVEDIFAREKVNAQKALICLLAHLIFGRAKLPPGSEGTSENSPAVYCRVKTDAAKSRRDG